MSQVLASGSALRQIAGEHDLQIQLMRALGEAIEAGDRPLILEVLARLEDTTNAHFLGEQLLMRLHAYPGYEVHSHEHDRLIEELGRLRAALAGGPHANLPPDFAGTMERWLLIHMNTMDQALAAYLDGPVEPPRGDA
jgi:hemerythrin-like metal-binding protein